MGTIGYTSTPKSIGINPARRIKRKEMKLTLKQRFRRWLNNDEYDQDIPQRIESDSFSSEGMRLQIYKASGGYVIETRTYDSHKDRHNANMHIITENDDLGNSLGKIVMMEALKR